MKFLHTSDWHLGMMFPGGISCVEDQKYAIDEICKIAVAEKVDGILLAGDVFDKSIASQEAIQMCDQIMTSICSQLNIPVYMVAGNHDGSARLSQYNKLLVKSGLHIAGALEREPQVYSVGDVDIYLLPWISTDKVKAVYPEAAEDISSLEEAYEYVLDQYRNTFKQDKKNIIVSHAFVVGAETSTSDRAAEVGRATMVGSFVFDGFDYVALGHIHGPQQITENIRYCGTPMVYSFGKEEKQVKSVTIIDTDLMEQKVVPVPQLRRRLTLTDTLDTLMKADFDESILNAYVRLDVTDSYVGIDTFARLRERYKNLIEVISPSFEREDATITMTIDELEKVENDPEQVFQKYCTDVLKEAPKDRFIQLFKNAVEEYNKEVTEG